MKRKERREEIRRPVEITQPKPRTFAAPACSLCNQIRPEGTNYSRIYGTVTREHGTVRYIRCHFCGNSWTVTAQTSAAPEESAESKPTPEADNL